MARLGLTAAVHPTEPRPDRPRILHGAILALGLLLILPQTAAAQGEDLASRAMIIDGEPDLVEGQDQEFVRALAFWLNEDSGAYLEALARDRVTPALTDFGETPEGSLAALEENVAPLPYAGSLHDLATLRSGHQGNSLDRARLLHAAVTEQGTRARIVSVAWDRENAYVEYPERAPTLTPVADDGFVALLAEQAAVAGPLWPRLCADGCEAWQALTTADSFEREVFWVQIFRDGVWSDLLPADTVVYPWARAAAEELTEERLAALTWRVTLRLLAGSGSEILAFSAPAARYQGESVTLINKPLEDLVQFQSVLVVGGDEQPSETYAIGSAAEAQGQYLEILVTGPGPERRYRRQLVPPRGTANDLERALEVATVVRVTVQTSQVSDRDHLRATALNARAAAAHLFEFEPAALVAANRNRPSLRAMTLLDAAHRTAGHMGAANKRVLAFQARPAVVLERDYVETTESMIERRYSLDLIDPGHGFLGPEGEPDTALRAALEQALVDGTLEDWIAYEDKSVTAHRALAALIEAAAPLDGAGPSQNVVADSFGGAGALYRTARNEAGMLAGWRLDPGPQAVPVIEPGLGGVTRTSSARERTQQLCGALDWGSGFVPMRVMPAGFLLPAFVRYQCALAEAYNKAADVLNNLFGDNPAQPDVGDQVKDLEEHIKKMGQDLAKDVVVDSMAQSISGATVGPALNHLVRNAVAPAARHFGREAGDFAARRIGRGASEGVERRARAFAGRNAGDGITETARKWRQSGPDLDGFTTPTRQELERMLSVAVTNEIKEALGLQRDLGMAPAGAGATAAHGGATRSIGPDRAAAVTAVMGYTERLAPHGYRATPAGWLDHNVAGRFNAAQAEKVAFVTAKADGPIAVDKLISADSMDFFNAAARESGRDLVVADPLMTYVFLKDGHVLGIAR